MSRGRKLVGAAVAALLGCAGAASAAPVQYAGNGHWYEFIPAGQDNLTFTWFEALADALTKTCTTCGATPKAGYLVTLTSSGENTFVADLATAGDNIPLAFWAAGSDAESEGNWIWKAGPENFGSFWNGGPGGSTAGTDYPYANWATGEPDNFNGDSSEPDPNPGEDGEDYLLVNLGDLGSWVDWDSGQDHTSTTPFFVAGYVVEFDGDVPEPASLAILGFGLGALGLVRRRRRG